MSRLTALALIGALVACAAPPPQPEPTRPEPQLALPASPDFEPGGPASPLLWHARGPQGALYLFGSVHAGDERVASFWPALADAFEASDEIVMELDLAQIRGDELSAFILEHGMIRPPDSLEKRLAPETLERLDAAFADLGVEPASIRQIEPWLLLLSMLGGSALEGLDVEQGVEHIVESRARDAASGASGAPPRVRPIVALETMESQLRIFMDLPPELQETLLLRTLDPVPDASLPDTEQLLRAWRRGDEAVLRSYLEPPDPAMREFMERLIFDRNARMAERLTALSDDGRTRLVVVGVLHMLGERGIPALLARRGFEIVPLR